MSGAGNPIAHFAADLAVTLAADRPGVLAAAIGCVSAAGINIEGYAEMNGVVHVLTPDLASFSDFALKALLRMPGVRGTRSSFIMQAVKTDLAWAPIPQTAARKAR